MMWFGATAILLGAALVAAGGYEVGALGIVGGALLVWLDKGGVT
jgi:hypothetical protein